MSLLSNMTMYCVSNYFSENLHRLTNVIGTCKPKNNVPKAWINPMIFYIWCLFTYYRYTINFLLKYLRTNV